MNKPKIALTIAGTDPTGGAGAMADLKSFHACGVYGMAAITSILAQNSLGVQHIHNLSATWLNEQLESVFNDEVPHAMKTGMIPNKEMMEVIAHYVKEYRIPYVIDPVMIAKSGDALMDDKGKSELQNILLPLADIATPNLPEAEEIVGFNIDSETRLDKAGKVFIEEIGTKGVIIKGGHASGDPIDYLYTSEGRFTYQGERYDTPHTHGTGCTFSAVITAELAKGRSVAQAVEKAKSFISLAIKHTPEIGRGRGPVNHFAYQKIKGLDDEILK